MAITLDASSNSGDKLNVTSVTYSHTVGTGSNTILIVGVGMRDTTAGDMVITGITYNSVALTKIRADAVTVDTSFRSELWYLKAPATGANNIVVSFTGTVAVAGVVGASFFGVDQTSPIDANNGNTGLTTSISASITVVASNSWLVDILYSRSSTLTKNASQTELANFGVNTNDDRVGSSYKPNVSSGSRTMDWTESNDGNDWTISVVSLAPAADSSTFKGFKTLLGVGQI